VTYVFSGLQCDPCTRARCVVGPCTKVKLSFLGYSVRCPCSKATYVVCNLSCCPRTKVMLFLGYSVVLVRKNSIFFPSFQCSSGTKEKNLFPVSIVVLVRKKSICF
jgi:hypothetical protein